MCEFCALVIVSVSIPPSIPVHPIYVPRYPMRPSIVQLLLASAESTLRRLVVDGTIAGKTEFPFAVALMECVSSGSDPNSEQECILLCSGALIAPNAVITAGHCLEPGGGTVIDVGSLYVLAGTNDYTDLNSGVLAKASSFVNKGFGKNIRFPGDDDMGLVFLESDLPLTEDGRIGTIPVAADETGTACGDKLTILGFGKDSNAATILGLPGGSLLRSGMHTVRAFSTCNKVYSDVVGYNVGDPESPHNQAIQQGIADTLLPEQHMCTSGAARMCFGDSGGPGFVTKADGSRVLVSISSFADARDADFCGGGVPFSMKLAGSTAWIQREMETHGKGWQPSDSFTPWPIPAPVGVSPKTRRTRCLDGQWQCMSGQCIDGSRVCDTSADCVDGTDENRCTAKADSDGPRNRRELIDTLVIDNTGSLSAFAANWSVRETYSRRRYGYAVIKGAGPTTVTAATPVSTTVRRRRSRHPLNIDRLPPYPRPIHFRRAGLRAAQPAPVMLDWRITGKLALKHIGNNQWVSPLTAEPPGLDAASVKCVHIADIVQRRLNDIRLRSPSSDADYDLSEVGPLCSELAACATVEYQIGGSDSICARVTAYVSNSEEHDRFMSTLGRNNRNECDLDQSPETIHTTDQGEALSALTPRPATRKANVVPDGSPEWDVRFMSTVAFVLLLILILWW